MKRKRSLLFEALEQRLCLDSSPVPPAYPGSPIILPDGSWTQTSFLGSPIFADLKGDGKQELIVEAAGNKMIAYATDASGNLVKFQEYDAAPLPDGRYANFKSTPVVVYAPGIGAVIVAALGHDEGSENGPNPLEDGRVYAFNAVTGRVLPGWPQTTHYPPPGTIIDSGVSGALTVGFLEGGNKPDVIVDSSSNIVTAFRMDGSKIWTYANDETVEPGAVVADLYGDGRSEVILDSGMSPGPFYPPGGYITILNGADGSLLRRIHLDEAPFGSPVIADLFGDGRKEIIAAPAAYIDTLPSRTAAQQAVARAAGDRIYAFFADGTPVPGWPYHTTPDDTTDHQTWKETVAADLYGNGQNEVIEIDRAGVLHVIGPNGRDKPGFVGGVQVNPSQAFVEGTGNDVFGTPIVADVNGDGKQDIIVSRGYYIAAFDNTGNIIWSTTTPISPGTNFPTGIGDAAAYGKFDPGGPPVLAFVEGSAIAPGPPLLVQVFHLPASPVAPAWPELRKDSMGQAIAFSSTAEAAYTTTAYSALFGRLPSPGELSYYVPLLTSKKFSRLDLAAKLAKAPEGRVRFPGALNVSDADTTAKVAAHYRAIGVATVPADSLAAVLYDAHRGRTYDDAAILIVGTNGNYAATNSVAPWAASVFRDIFNVNPTPEVIAGIVKQVDAGEGRGDVVKGLLVSPDARKGYIISQVAALLGRPATAADFGLANYARREDVVVSILAGPEFYARSGGTPAGFVNKAFTTLIALTPSAATVNMFANQLNNGTITRAGLARSLITGSNGSLYLNNFVVASMFRLIPDPSKGDLRARFGSPGPFDNPNPVAVAIYTNLLVSGQGNQETVLASLMTSPQYLADASYLRGIFVSPGVRS